MAKFLSFLLLLHSVLLVFCLEQADLDYVGNNLGVKFEVIDNLFEVEKFKARIHLTNDGNNPIVKGPWAIYLYNLFMIEPDHLPHEGEYAIPNTNLLVSHENGNLFKMRPGDNFSDFGSGATLMIDLVIQFWTVSKSDVMPNWYVAAEGLEPRLVKSTADGNEDFIGDFSNQNQYKRYDFDEYNPFTPKERFDRYNYNSAVTEKVLIPTPLEYKMSDNSETATVNNQWKVKCQNFDDECSYLREQLSLEAADSETAENIIEITSGSVDISEEYSNEESYSLIVRKEKITITASTAAGAFYGIQSLLSLHSSSSGNITEMDIKDAPRFAYRGMHLDVARNFVSKEEVLKTLKVMAMYKLNHFHFHLTDDEGWRLQLNTYPELTEIASKRAHDPNETTSIIPQFGSGPDDTTSGSGFYTQDEYREILQLAEDLHIKVIPEFDMPGHTHAAIKANLVKYNEMLANGINETEAASILISDLDDETVFLSVQMFTDNAMNPCIEGTYQFVRNLVKELEELHNGTQPLTTFHIGGDEIADAWVNSPKCQELFDQEGFPNKPEQLIEYFMGRATEAIREVSTNELEIAVWEDGAVDANDTAYDKETAFAGSEVTAYAWQNIWEWGVAKRAYNLANAGYKVVLSPATHLYFDQPHEPDPEERGQYWASRFTDTKKSFSYMPENVYANADAKRSGESYDETKMCSEHPCPRLQNPENIIGIQGHLWSETVRNPSHLHYMIFPRMLAMAERAWHKSEWEATQTKDLDTAGRDQEWTNFAATVGSKELKRLEKAEIEYRISVPGANVESVDGENGNIHVLCELPTTEFVYKNANADSWSNPLSCGSKISVRSDESVNICGISADKNRYGRSIAVTYDGASNRFEANFIFVFVTSAMSLFYLR